MIGVPSHNGIVAGCTVEPQLDPGFGICIFVDDDAIRKVHLFPNAPHVQDTGKIHPLAAVLAPRLPPIGLVDSSLHDGRFEGGEVFTHGEEFEGKSANGLKTIPFAESTKQAPLMPSLVKISGIPKVQRYQDQVGHFFAPKALGFGFVPYGAGLMAICPPRFGSNYSGSNPSPLRPG